MFIHFSPTMFEGFLDIFDKPIEEDLVGFHVENYKGHTITANDLTEIMVTSRFGVFGVASKIPYLLEDMDIHMVEQNNAHFVCFNLAPFLGLPSENPVEQLAQLKNLLVWLKDETVNNPKETIKLCLSRDNKEATFDIYCSDKTLETTLNQQFNEKINNSPALTMWRENQKLGFMHTEPQCKYLSSSMDCLDFMNMYEQQPLLEQRRSHNTPNKRKNTGLSKYKTAENTKVNKSFF